MIGDRIKQARIALGMTQDEVVAALATLEISLTKAGLSKYERGGSTPKPTVLRALARVLGVDSSFFMEDPSFEVQWLAFRKASGMGKRRQKQVKAFAESQLEVILDLRHSLELGREQPPPPKTRVRCPEDIEKAAESLRDCWHLGDQPIDSVTAVIEDNGGVVIESGSVPLGGSKGGRDSEDDLFDALSGWVDGKIPVVVVSAGVSDDRKRFSLAHELGHLFMDLDTDPAKEERYAHRFAAAFMVKATTARRELGSHRRHLDFSELALLKRKHGLSMQAWIFRASDLGIIEESHARTLFAEMGNRGWRRQEPVDFRGEERSTKLRQLTVRALAEGLLSHRQAERIYPGVTQTLDEIDKEPIGAMDPRTLLKLPASQRNALLEQAAATVSQEYEANGSLTGFESLSEEDYFDTSVIDDE